MTGKQSKLNRAGIIAALVTLLVVLLLAVFSVSLAANNNWLEVDRNYTAYSSTDTITLFGGGTNTLTVNRTLGSTTADDSKDYDDNDSYQRDDLSFHYSKVDFVLYTAAPIGMGDITLADTSGVTLSSYKQADESYCVVVKDVPISGSSVTLTLPASPSSAYVFPAEESATGTIGGETVTERVSYANTYVDTFFNLQSANSGNLYNSQNALTVNGKFRNLFFVNSFTIDKNFTINTPCSLNLLRAVITLDKNLTVKHNYGGIYQITSIMESYAYVGKIVRGGTEETPLGSFSLNARFAVYEYEEGIIPTGSAVNMKVITTAEAENYITELLSDAEDFIDAYIPKRLYSNIELPLNFNVSGVRFSYSIPNGGDLGNFTQFGEVIRGPSTKTVTLSIKATYVGNYLSYVADGAAASSTFSRSIDIVGTNAESLAGELLELIGDGINEAYNVEEVQGEKIYDIRLDLDLKNLLSVFAKINDSQIDLSLYDQSYSCFRITDGDEVVDTTSFTINANNTITFMGSGGETTRNRGQIGIVLRPSMHMIADDIMYFNAYYDSSNVISSFKVRGMDFDDVCRYLESFIDTPAFSDSIVGASAANILSVVTGRLYKGSDIINAVGNTLGVTLIETKAFAIDEESLQELIDDPQIYSDTNWSLWSTKPSEFTILPASLVGGTVTGGTITAHILEKETTYVLVQRFTIGSQVYYAYRQMIIPERGMGGDGASQYMSGETFQDFYNDLDGGKLIETDYQFSVQTIGVSIFVVLESTDGNAAYLDEVCKVKYRDAQGVAHDVNIFDEDSYTASSYYLDVNIAELEARNTTARVVVYFYYSAELENFMAYIGGDDSKSSSYFTMQTYGFTIPGIYKYNASSGDFKSLEFYDFVLNAKDSSGNYLFSSYHPNADEEDTLSFTSGNYLYVDGASAAIPFLDCTSISAPSGISLKGIELLSGTRGFSFRGVKINEVASAFTKNVSSIAALDLSGCQLTDAIIGNYLARCTALVYADLSNNSLTSVNGIVYRTATHLNLSNNNITSISGIKNLPDLEYVNLSGNSISYFGELTSLAKLKAVVVSNNSGAGVSNVNVASGAAFGTDGQVNIPVYIQLMNVQGAVVINKSEFTVLYTFRLNSSYMITVFETHSGSLYAGELSTEKARIISIDGAFEIGSDVTYAQQEACLALTGVEYNRRMTYSAADNFSVSMNWAGVGTVTVSQGSNPIVNSSYASISSSPGAGVTFYIIVSTTYGGATMYALYEVIAE